jgi:hypothetical protein
VPEPASPTAVRRIALVGGWFGAVGLALLVLHLLGVDVEGWFTSLWDALTALDPEYVLVGLGLQTLETLLSAFAWLAIVHAAYPQAEIQALPIVTTYAVAVAGNDVLQASLGTVVMLVMLAAIIPGATFPGLVGAQCPDGGDDGTVSVSWETEAATAVRIEVDGAEAESAGPSGAADVTVPCDGADHEITVVPLSDAGEGEAETETVSSG